MNRSPQRKLENWLPVLSGEKKGLLPTLQRSGLVPLSYIYRTIVGLRNRRFDGQSAITRVQVPVISIGNVTTGGTGKTPMVQWICRQLRNHDLRVALLSRGYGAAAGEANDEALELELSLPDVPHLQDPDRCQSASVAIEELASQCLVLDDGFQHRKLGRDLDIVLIDATEPFGYGYCLPRGLLREPLSGLRRADAVVITRVDHVSESRLAEIRQVIQRYVQDGVPIATCVHRATQLVDSRGKKLPIESLKDKSIYALAGIGNPPAFFNSVVSLGGQIVKEKVFPDHHGYQREDIEEIKAEVQQLEQSESSEWQDGWIVTTRKDLVKLNIQSIAKHPVWALQIEIEFLTGEDQLKSLVEGIVNKCPQDEW